MYEQFFGLRRSPFGLTPDPEFMYFTEAHRDAAAGLIYSIQSRKGFSALIGDAGTGKTTLLRLMMSSIPPHLARFSFIIHPLLTPLEFLQMVLADFGIKGEWYTKAPCLVRLQEFLLEERKCNRIPVVVVDDAQRLSYEVLEEIRLLTKCETDKEKLLHIVLAGQDELGELLDRRELRQLKQLVATRLTVGALREPEVANYIAHRWRKATERASPFSPAVISLIAESSGGIPRVINALCDNCLLLAFAEGDLVVRREYVLEAAKLLHLAVGISDKPEAGARVPQRTPAPAAAVTSNGAPSNNDRMHLSIPPPERTRLEENPIPTLQSYSPAGRWRLRLAAVFGRSVRVSS
jgi:general secretion pathway protein A